MSIAQKQVLIASMLVTFAFGSIHAFSVFLPPLEQSLGLPRAKLSLIYSFSLIALTVMVLFGYRMYGLIKPSMLILLSAVIAFIGLYLAAGASSWFALVVFYSVIFGATNGIAYGYCLQLVGRTLPDNKKAFGMAMVTATYAVGSVCFSFLLGYLVSHYSAPVAMKGLGMSILAVGMLASVLLKLSQVQYAQNTEDKVLSGAEQGKVSKAVILLLWLSYCAAVFAGLMAIGHATGIIQALGGDYSLGVWSAVFIGVGSSIGGILIGFALTDKNINLFLFGLPLISALFLGSLVITQTPVLAVCLLSFVGMAYGALIAVYPFAIANYFGDELGPKIYGEVFTAWGFAGLAGPWIAGRLYDFNGEYQLAVAVAGSIAVLSILCFYAFLKYKATHPLIVRA